MKNLFLLMTAILIVNVSTYAESSVMDGMGESDTECSFINDASGADESVNVDASGPSSDGSTISQ